MTKKEAAIVSAYTGFLIGEFSEVQKYIEKIIGRPVFTHELADKHMQKKIEDLSKQDFISITVQD